jgi:hypothetical protein
MAPAAATSSATATGHPGEPASGALAQPHGPDQTAIERPTEAALITSTAPATTRTAGLARRTTIETRRDDSTSQLAATPSTANAASPTMAPSARAIPTSPGPPDITSSATPATIAPAAAPSHRPRSSLGLTSAAIAIGAMSRKLTSAGEKPTGPCQVPNRSTASIVTISTAGPNTATLCALRLPPISDETPWPASAPAIAPTSSVEYT